MTEIEKEELLTIDDYEEFERVLSSINKEYVNNYELWDEDLLNHYYNILTEDISKNSSINAAIELTTDVDVKLG